MMDRTSDHGHAAQRLDERRARGAEWRRQVPLSAQAEWNVPPDRTDPVEILIGQGKTRIAELLPIRYARMKANPFAFLRGAAAIMAADLASGPTTGLRVQACGDCHLANFGAYATPEGNPVFDVNDFDETLPASFEWDVKRLAVSLAVASRVASASDREARQLARTATKNYRRHLGQLALLSPLEAWSSRIDLAGAIADIGSPKTRRKIEKDARLADIGTRLEAELPFYAALCGRTLARAHARSGDAVALSGYMGDDSGFDKAIAEFAIAYTDQTERDWRTLLDAIKAGRISAGEQHFPSC